MKWYFSQHYQTARLSTSVPIQVPRLVRQAHGTQNVSSVWCKSYHTKRWQCLSKVWPLDALYHHRLDLVVEWGWERRFYSLASGLCSFVTNLSLSDLCSLSTRDVIDLKEHLMTSHWKDHVVISMYKDIQLDVYEHSATRKVVYIDSGWL